MFLKVSAWFAEKTRHWDSKMETKSFGKSLFHKLKSRKTLKTKFKVRKLQQIFSVLQPNGEHLRWAFWTRDWMQTTSSVSRNDFNWALNGTSRWTLTLWSGALIYVQGGYWCFMIIWLVTFCDSVKGGEFSGGQVFSGELGMGKSFSFGGLRCSSLKVVSCV